MTENVVESGSDWSKDTIEAGEWAGWSQYTGDAFEEHAGPFYHRRDGEHVVCAMQVEAKHMNGGGSMHGGALMTFADAALFSIAQSVLVGTKAVTATMNCELAGAVPLGARIECTGEVFRNTRSMVFVRAVIRCEGEPVMSFSGVLKKVGRRS